MRVAAARCLTAAAARCACRAATSAAPTGSAAFAVPVRCSVTVDAHGAEVDVVRGAHDAVAARWWAGGKVGRGAAVACAQEGSAITITVPPGAADRVEVAIPGRYCGVTASTRGAPFTLAALAEAALDVRTGGSSVTLHTARCTTATVASGGGAVAVGADLSAETVAVATGGGAARLARLTAVSATVDTAGGDLAVDALYCDRAVARTAGGALSITHAAVRLGLDATTGGGAVTLSGVDGVARLDTGGGEADVRLSAGVVAVAVATRGGRARLQLAPELTEHGAASVLIEGEGGIVLLGAPGDTPASVAAAVDAALAARDAPASGHSPPAPAGTPVPAGLDPGGEGRRGGGGRLRDHGRAPPVALVDATPGGAVAVRQASWIEGALGRAHEAAEARQRGGAEG